MLPPVPIPGLLVTGTDTDVGKTLVAAAVADWFRRRHRRVGVLNPIATGCVHRREGLVSEDAEFLAHCAEARFPLDVICPVRYAEPLAPSVAAEREKRPVDWDAVQRSLRMIQTGSDVMIVEGVGGVLVPLDANHTVIDLAHWLKFPAIVVVRAGLGTINHTLLTVNALRDADVNVAGVVINRYPADGASVAEETNPRVIEKLGKVPVLCVVPEEKLQDVKLPKGVVAAVENVDWERFASTR